MLREQVITNWNNLKQKLLEYQELRPQFLKLKGATWKTYAKRVLLLSSNSINPLNEVVSRWYQEDYYKIVNNPTGFSRELTENLVDKWKVITVKCLTVEEKDDSFLEEVILPDHFAKKVKASLANYQEAPISRSKRIDWK